MGNINSTYSLVDQVSGPLNSITGAVMNATSAMNSLHNASNSSHMAGNAIQAANAQHSHNNSISEGTGEFKRFATAAAGAALAVLGVSSAIEGISNLVKLSDDMTNLGSRIDMINDGTQTQVELQDKIFAAAQRSRTGYMDMTDSVAKLNLLAGDAFTGNDDALAFAEILGKSYKIAGTSASDAADSTRQLVQALSSGRLMGDEFVSVSENAPLVAAAIAKAMGVSKGELKKLSSDGMITADIIKKAMYDASGDIEKAFNQMAMTTADKMTIAKNEALKLFQPLLDRINQFVNSPLFDRWAERALAAVGALVTGLQVLMTAFEWVMQVADYVATIISDNWGVLEPIFIGIGAALGTIATVLLLNIARLAIMRTWTLAVATAQWIVNAAYLAFPGTWILIAFVAIIALVIYALIKWADATASVVGAIVGSFVAMGAALYNVALFIANMFLATVEFIVNAWLQGTYLIHLAWYTLNVAIRMILDGIFNAALTIAEAIANIWVMATYSISMAWYKMKDMALSAMQAAAQGAEGMINAALTSISTLVNGAISGLNKLIGMANNIPGVNIGTVGEVSFSVGKAASSGIAAYRSNMKAPEMPKAVKLPRSNLTGNYMKNNPMPQKPGSVKLPRFEYKDLGNAYDLGNKIGKKASSNTSDKLTKGLDKLKDSLKKLKKGPGDKKGAGALGKGADSSGLGDTPGGKKGSGGPGKKKGDGKLKGGKLDSIGKIEKDINIADEDLKMLRDYAEKQAIQNFTSLTPTVKVTGTKIGSETDMKKLIAEIEKLLTDQINKSAKGAYNG